MKIFYEEGPEAVSTGEAGIFKRGEPKEVADYLAEDLLKKQTIKFINADENEAPRMTRHASRKKKEEK